MRSFALSGIVILALALLPSSALGAEPSLEQMEQAREFYETASTAFKANDYPVAEKNFRKVYELLHTPNALFDVALCEEKQEKWAAAADDYALFLRVSPKVADRKAVEKHIIELLQRERHPEQAVPAVAPAAGTTPAEPGDVTKPSPSSITPAIEPPKSGPEVATVDPKATTPGALTTTPDQKATTPDQKVSVVPSPTTPEKPAEAKKSRWWIWAVAGGVAAVALGVGLGVGLGVSGNTSEPSPTFGTYTDSLTSGRF